MSFKNMESEITFEKMESLIYMDSEYISPLGLLVGEVFIIAISYLLACIKERLPGGNKTLHP